MIFRFLLVVVACSMTYSQVAFAKLPKKKPVIKNVEKSMSPDDPPQPSDPPAAPKNLRVETLPNKKFNLVWDSSSSDSSVYYSVSIMGPRRIKEDVSGRTWYTTPELGDGSYGWSLSACRVAEVNTSCVSCPQYLECSSEVQGPGFEVSSANPAEPSPSPTPRRPRNPKQPRD